MKVFLDIEWIENGENSLTQLSAVRVDEDGERTNQLDILVRPHESAFAEPWHVAFGHYPAETFLSGVSERECMQQFRAWLYADDQIWIWVRSNKKRLIKAWEMHCAPEVLPEVRLMAKRARRAVFGDENEVGTPFELLRLLRIDPPRVEHRSCDDVEALRLLMNTLHLADKPAKAESQQNFTEQAVVPLALRRERNREMISRTQYSFLFLKNAEVFHRRGCSVCLNARETGDILGSVYYKTAAHMRRPCKICKPKPEVDEECSGVGGRKAPAESAYIKMLTGETVWRKRSKILGWCHCWRHPGAVDRELFKKHRCSEKECRHFQRNEECQYWVQMETLREKKEKKKRRAAIRYFMFRITDLVMHTSILRL